MFSINVLYLVRDGNRCWRRRSCRGSPRRRTLGVDVSPYRLSVDSQLPSHPSNGHPLKLGLLHRLPSLLLQKRRLPRRCDDPQPGYVRIVDCSSVSIYFLIRPCARQCESCQQKVSTRVRDRRAGWWRLEKSRCGFGEMPDWAALPGTQ